MCCRSHSDIFYFRNSGHEGAKATKNSLFKSFPVAKEIQRIDALAPAARVYERDVITLGWEDRLKARARRQSDNGFGFATTLPRGTVVRQDDCFVFDAQRTIVRVVELAEPVLVIRPEQPQDWAMFACQIGNSHQPLMLDVDAIVCPDVLGMAHILKFHRIPFQREDRRFTPLGHIPDHQHQLDR